MKFQSLGFVEWKVLRGRLIATRIQALWSLGKARITQLSTKRQDETPLGCQCCALVSVALTVRQLLKNGLSPKIQELMPGLDGHDESFQIKSVLTSGEFQLSAKGLRQNETQVCSFRKLTKTTHD